MSAFGCNSDSLTPLCNSDSLTPLCNSDSLTPPPPFAIVIPSPPPPFAIVIPSPPPFAIVIPSPPLWCKRQLYGCPLIIVQANSNISKVITNPVRFINRISSLCGYTYNYIYKIKAFSISGFHIFNQTAFNINKLIHVQHRIWLKHTFQFLRFTRYFCQGRRDTPTKHISGKIN